jgi:hypothetical protein
VHCLLNSTAAGNAKLGFRGDSDGCKKNHLSELHEPREAWRLLYVPSGLTVNSSAFVFMKCIYVLCVDFRTNCYYFPGTSLTVRFYNRDGECLLRGTDWVFK